jgi:hypothetical protein
MNCGGIMLFHFHPGANIKEKIVILKSECSQIVCNHSLPQIVDPEIREPVTWTVAYSIPIALLERYCQVITPALNVEWKANFYKCADKTSHPHCLIVSDDVTFQLSKCRFIAGRAAYSSLSPQITKLLHENPLT